MATGCLDIIFFGALSWLFENLNKAKNKKLDRVEIQPHTWIGMSGKTRYNTRYLGPIQVKTFLSTSKKMVSKVKEYETVLNELISDQSEYYDIKKQNKILHLIELNKNILKYMRQIDRREALRCYAEWKDDYSDSFLAYQYARTKAIELDSKLLEIKENLNKKILT